MAKISLSMIAKEAKVSIASVSRVLRTPNLTSPQTQFLVYQAMKALNVDLSKNLKDYQPVHESNKILVVDNQLISKSLINFGIEQVLHEAGFQLFYLQFPYKVKNDLYYLIQYIKQNCFIGIIIINQAPYLTQLYSYKNSLPPIVFVNHFKKNFTCVHFDHLTIGYQTTQHLIEQGHNKIAIFINSDKNTNSSFFLQGYQQAFQRINMPIDSDYVIQGCLTYEHGRDAIKTLLQSNKPPTAVIFEDLSSLSCYDYYHTQNYLSNYRSLFGALHQVKKSQSQLLHPLAITYISHTNDLQYNELDQLSRVNKPLYKMGCKSAQLLCDLLEHNMTSLSQCHTIDTEMFFTNC
ncbi:MULTISPECIES: LacI family DNA-binding transcriptional regulator [unclassified Gilliamella]|uniref:LacI family DNA-binding transcriptional regulator n=1 Tax=unclassified Gilliamella TaxID=2685620 RepID=UPI00226A9BBF|nr:MULTISPECIES: LacI family DNA-binding transcriptional regulator [unclassified Gilliamella]MCX8583643.1 LacI family DNA-binding transcriptional regulator [Gilliamella sp. B3372]MCX8594775.1 LacI family DNA-binding transcriptional regulator [Gilliamella sp. B3367]